MKRRLLRVLLVISLLVVPVSQMTQVSAHQSGCHRWHSCPSDTGSYVCGDTGYTSGCGTTSVPAPVPPTPVAPRTPIITTRNIVTTETIDFADEIENDSHEYVDYSKVSQTGEPGKAEVSTAVTYTDSRETSRNISTKLTKIQAKSKKTVKGTRIKPLAKIDSISKTKKKDKFDINGTTKPKSEVVLSLNGRKIKRMKTNSNGKFTFRGIKIKNNDSNLKIYNRENRKEKQISELTFLNLSSNKITTEYQKLNEKS